MATGSKAGLYQNAQSASYLPLTLVYMVGKLNWNFMSQNSNSIFPPCRVSGKKEAL